MSQSTRPSTDSQLLDELQDARHGPLSVVEASAYWVDSPISGTCTCVQPVTARPNTGFCRPLSFQSDVAVLCEMPLWGMIPHSAQDVVKAAASTVHDRGMSVC